MADDKSTTGYVCSLTSVFIDVTEGISGRRSGLMVSALDSGSRTLTVTLHCVHGQDT